MREHLDTPSVTFQFRWSPNSFRGFGVSMGVLAIILLVSMCTKPDAPDVYAQRKSTGVTLLRLGDGDGTGARKGNLTREGAKQKGRDAQNPLADASRAQASNVKTDAGDPNHATRLKAVNDVGKPDANEDQTALGDRTVGSTDGDRDGTGLGMAGTGRGAGEGYGNIDWGGGGNRTVTEKVLPEFPPGTRNTQVKLRFRVRPDGTVSFVMPVRKGGDPAADAAASRALRRWRFNKLASNEEMEGTITFVFRGS